MEAWMLAIAVLGLVLTAGGLLAAGVWCVGRITGSVDALGGKVDGLGNQVHDLALSVRELDNKLDGHAERIARLEERGAA